MLINRLRSFALKVLVLAIHYGSSFFEFKYLGQE